MALDPALLCASLSVVERRADQASAYFYAHLFANNPDVRSLFPVEMAEQQDRLFAALTRLVGLLDTSERLGAYLATLGRDHRKFEVRPEHYPAVGASLLATLRQFCGNTWTPAVEKAWTEAYSVIAQAMIDAAAAVSPATPAWWDARVVERQQPQSDLVILTLAPDRSYPFLPGQYLTLCSPHAPRVWRPFSIANAPRPDGTVELHVRKVPEGMVSTALVDATRVGEALRLGPPLGDAVLPSGSQRPLLAVAGGTGWGQTKAVLEQVAYAPRRTTLFLGGRCDGDHYDSAGVRLLAQRHPWLEVVSTVPGERVPGSAGVRMMQTAILEHGSWAGHDVHLSGPPDMVREVAGLLRSRCGVAGELIRHDPLPTTFCRSRPTNSAERFLMERDVCWINRTELGI
ncbi:globin domain-containing protein [Streptomyces naganishii]|uniref:nitric oxide dioxygenase n=1 Tax=Streptomyces naganishii JCM 4654 TaxID=1306179 RepID=A0A918Y6S8_9ACTN|nr:globin domain-containing protein [Streptomyces naganishii]GHD91792.1 oxidoreductase [Streptomyces naganishii JCM 4654]